MINEDDSKIKELTHRYWREEWRPEKYIKELLPKELEYLKKDNRISTDGAEVLVQLVGFSWEPLLIAVCAYKPQKIVLILNKWYNNQEGKNRGKDFKEYINKLKEQRLIDNTPVILPDPLEPVMKDKPEDVFKFLKKYILPSLNEGKRIVIDITGGKKSMVSGAYLFSSYTKCPVSYVDFDEYDEKYHRPFGYKCRLEELKDPIERFKLREWSRVEQLYEQYAFKAAMKLIDDIKERTTSLLEEEELKGIDFLKKCLEFYGTWDEGDYKGAWEKYQQLNIKSIICPTAVEKLGKGWFDKNNLKESIESIEGRKNINNSIYLKDAELLVYAIDELEKVKRLVKYNEDYRSALLRAAGLNEFLFRARAVQLWIENQLMVEINGQELTREIIKDNSKHLSYLSEIERNLLDVSITPLYLSLSRSDRSIKLRRDDPPITAHRSNSARLLKEFWKTSEKPAEFDLPNDVFELRNKAIHFCLSISKEIAEVAVKFAEGNLKDFKDNWTNAIIDGKYEAISWHDLCDACGIKFLPKLRE